MESMIRRMQRKSERGMSVRAVLSAQRGARGRRKQGTCAVRRRILAAIVSVMLGALPVAGAVGTINAYAASGTVTQADIDAALPGIVCWGDSLTYGIGGDGVTYPDYLRYLIDVRLIQPLREQSGNASLTAPEVVNLGVSGETTLSIAGRQGGVPLVVLEEFTIPAECVEVNFEYGSSVRGEMTKLILASDGGVETVTICGVEGELIRYYDASVDHSRYRFRRLTAGEAVTVPAGSVMITNLYTSYLDYIPIIQMGGNGGWDDLTDLAAQFQMMLSHSDSSDRYIIVGTPRDDETDVSVMQQEDDYLTLCFGEHALSLRQWMIENGLSTAASILGVEESLITTSSDLARIEAGRVPFTLLNEDQVHYNSTGYAVMAEMYYEKLDELGYFDGLKALAK